jgi:hypothetical protein
MLHFRMKLVIEHSATPPARSENAPGRSPSCTNPRKSRSNYVLWLFKEGHEQSVKQRQNCLCFQILTRCFSRKPFPLTTMRKTWGGGVEKFPTWESPACLANQFSNLRLPCSPFRAARSARKTQSANRELSATRRVHPESLESSSPPPTPWQCRHAIRRGSLN